MGQSKAKVSVVIPAYNAEQYLPEQLEALLNNTVSIAEIIVSDNGSTDSTKDLVLKAAEKHENVKYLDAGQRQGPNYARNKGIEQAGHELVLLCDADDIVAEDWAEKLLGALETADLVGSGYYTYLFSEVSGRYEISSASIEQPTVFNDQVYSLSCSMGMKKAVFALVGGFDESYRGGHEEVDFCLRVSAAGLVQGWVAEPLIRYRQRRTTQGLAQQSRRYGRTWVQLAVNFSPVFDGHIPSAKLMVRKVVSAVPGYLKQKQHSWTEVRGFWWNIGRLEGILCYRVLRRIPPRRLHLGPINGV